MWSLSTWIRGDQSAAALQEPLLQDTGTNCAARILDHHTSSRCDFRRLHAKLLVQRQYTDPIALALKNLSMEAPAL